MSVVSAAPLSPRARRDLLTAVAWIARDNPAAARALRDAVAKAVKRIARHVQIGSTRFDLADDHYRFLNLTGFPYVIVYCRSQTAVDRSYSPWRASPAPK